MLKNGSIFAAAQGFTFLTLLACLCLVPTQSWSQTACPGNNNHDFRVPLGGATCGSNDLIIQAIRVVDPNQTGNCVNCPPGTVVTWNLEVDVLINQSSCRECIAIAADLHLSPTESCVLSRLDRTSQLQGQGNVVTLDMGELTFTCGQQLSVTDLVLGYAANCNSNCTSGNFTPSGGKCSRIGDYNIKTPVGASCYEVPAECIGGNGEVGVNAFGGTPGYTYAWEDDSGNSVGSQMEISVPVGTYHVTVTDSEGCTAECSVTLTTADDNTNPTITCPGTINQNNDPGSCGAAVTFQATADDNCPGVTVTYSHQPGSFFPVGTTAVTATATDASGNQASCQFNVIVADNEASAQCMNTTVQLDASGNASITPSDVDNNSTDNCGIASMSVSPNTFTCENLGANTVTLTIVDIYGNTDQCSATVTVEDNINPTITCPANIVVDNDPGACGAIVTYSATGSDNCGYSITYNPPSGSFFDISTTTTVIATITDDANNSATCSFTVTVNDNLAPGINCPSNISISCEDSTDPSNTGTATSSDACSNASVTIDFSDVTTPGNCPNEYTITRTWTATDASGNTTSCAQTIDIIDNTPPQVTCPGPVAVQCESDVPAPDISAVSATDNCDGAIAIEWVNDVSSGSNPIVITRTYQATDVCGNVGSCTQTITVQNLTAPSLTCPANITVECFGDVPAADPDQVVASATCGGTVNVSWVGDVQAGSCPTIITRTYQGIDETGFITMCTQQITVLDTIAPTLTSCPGDLDLGCITTPPTTGLLPAPITDPAILGASDNCTPAGNLIVTNADIGPTIDGCYYIFSRIYLVSDDCGNIAVCDTQNISFVYDITPPEFVDGPAEQVFGCNDPVPPVPPAPVAIDGCPGGVTITFQEIRTNASCLGEAYNRVWTATDACGNQSTYTQIASRQDTSAPELIIPNDTIVGCPGDIPPLEYEINETCDKSRITENYKEEIMPGSCDCQYTLLRIWDVYNHCLSRVRDTQYIEVLDTSGPQITVVNPMLGELENGGTMRVYECFEPNVGMEDIEVSDCCGIASIRPYDSLIAYNSCEAFDYFARWVCGYEVIDYCGNKSEFRFYVEQVDTMPPGYVLPDGFEDRIDVECGFLAPGAPDVQLEDQCDLQPMMQFHADTFGFFPDSFAIVRSWGGLDACFNAGEITQTISVCGFEPSEVAGAVGNLVWLDENGNGLQDKGETGLNGVIIELYKDLDLDNQPDEKPYRVAWSSHMNGNMGQYQFRNLNPGRYFIKVVPNPEYVISPMSDGQANEMDSDIDPVSGFSPRFEISEAEFDYSIDIGLTRIPRTDPDEEEEKEDDEEHAVTNALSVSTFSVEKNGCENVLKWQTSSEALDQEFVVQRSIDDDNFNSIHTLSTIGHPSDYQYIDNDPFDATYYRLALRDGNGESGYSSTILMENTCVDKWLNFTVYPNPSSGEFAIRHTRVVDNVDAKLLDIFGREIKHWNVKGEHQIDRVSLRGLTPGVYLLQLGSGNQMVSKPIVLADPQR